MRTNASLVPKPFWISTNLRCVVAATLIAATLIAVVGCGKQTPVQEITVQESGIQVQEVSLPSSDANLDWPQWRGGVAGNAGDAAVPTQWSDTENVRWVADVPGRGHSSPIVVGDLVVLGSATEQPEQQVVIAYDRDTGTQRWQTVVHNGGFPPTQSVHPKATNANSTLASDGKHFVTAHLNNDRVWVTALDTDGNQVWQTDVGAFDSKFGYAPSPILYKSLVLVAGDNRGGGYLVALDMSTGEIAWRRSRESASSYSSPALVNVAGTDQIVMTGLDKMISYDPATGDPLWETNCIAEATCGTVIACGDLLLGSGGYPSKETVCISAAGDRVWSNRTKIYEPSMITDGQNVYAFSDDGIGYCWNAADGTELWKKRLGGNFSSSPVLAGGNLYVSDLSGNGYVIRATGDQFVQVAKNQLGDDCYASPAIAGNAIYFRVGVGRESQRRERLYCIAERPSGE